jgi:hypothetical protein
MMIPNVVFDASMSYSIVIVVVVLSLMLCCYFSFVDIRLNRCPEVSVRLAQHLLGDASL